MAFRSRTLRSARKPRKKPIWVNIPFGSVTFTESVGTQLLMTAEDWEAQFSGLANETSTLRAIVGEINIAQTAAGTAGGTGFWGIYVHDKDATVAPTFTTSGMQNCDWLRVGCLSIQSTVTQSLASTRQLTWPIEVRAKRKLKSRDGIWIAAQYGADAASPAGSIGGLLRFLVARD